VSRLEGALSVPFFLMFFHDCSRNRFFYFMAGSSFLGNASPSPLLLSLAPGVAIPDLIFCSNPL